ncbi:hypothetical protein ACPEEZ_02870 [Frigoribacterium sp. 2-23]|uniref:hypothetical protein n=1 Tax=Frigoribacterium sp. 2-23 TaxID=3415006 RepID=UPI003C6FCDC2
MTSRQAVVIDVDVPSWLLVPTGDGATDAWREAATQLLALAAEADVAVSAAPPRLDPVAAVDGLVALAASLGDGSRVVAGLDVPGAWPLPVVVEAGLTGDDAPDLLERTRARGGTPLESPIVDDLPDGIGPGIVSTRFDLDTSGAVWATVAAARRRDGLDVVATWRTTDLSVVPQFTPHVVSLLGSVRLVTVEATTA